MAKKNDDDLFEDVPYAEIGDDLFEDVPYSEDSIDMSSFEEEEKPDVSKLESLARGIPQGLTVGFGEELGAAALTPLEILRQKISKLIPGSSENVDAELREQGFTGDAIQEESASDTYKTLRDTSRKADDRAEEANPMTYMAGDIAGGVLPAIATGGGTAAANVAKSLGKPALKEAMKKAAKLGSKYGAVAGAGYSEADNIEDLATDTVAGGVGGAVLGTGMPVLAKGGKEALKGLSSGAKKLLGSLPGVDTAKLSYKYGKEGKKVLQDTLDEDVMITASTVLKKIQADKEANSIIGMRETLSNAGVKINADSEIAGTIKDLQKIAAGNYLAATDKTILSKMEALAGKNAQAEKMADKAEKQALKKMLESEGKEAQAIIKGEKDLAKQSIKSGDEIQTITDLNKPMDQMDLPLSTPNGRISGVSGKFKNVDGEEYVSKQLTDTTPYQPELSKTIGPNGRPIVQTLDKGSGKITALVGDMDDILTKLDLENMTLVEGKDLLNQINVITDIAKKQGTVKDPAIKRLMKLAGELRELEKGAIEKHGDVALSNKTARFSDIFTAEELLGVKDKLHPRADVDTVKKTIEIGNRLGFEKGFGTRQEGKLAKDLLGKEVMTPAATERFDFLQKLNALTGRTSVDDNVSKAGIFKKMVTDIPNVAGRAVKKTSDMVDKVSSPVKNVTDTIGSFTKSQSEQFINRLNSSGDKGSELLGRQLTYALSQDDSIKTALIWQISTQPAFRQLMQKNVKSFNEDAGNFVEDENRFADGGISSVDLNETLQGYADKEPNQLEGINKIIQEYADKPLPQFDDSNLPNEYRGDYNSDLPKETLEEAFNKAYAEKGHLPFSERGNFKHNGKMFHLRKAGEVDPAGQDSILDKFLPKKSLSFEDSSFEAEEVPSIQASDLSLETTSTVPELEVDTSKPTSWKKGGTDVNEFYEGESSDDLRPTLETGYITGKLTGGDLEKHKAHSDKTNSNVKQINPHTGEIKKITGRTNIGYDYKPYDKKGKEAVEGTAYNPARKGKVVLSGVDEKSPGHGNSVIIRDDEKVNIGGKLYDIYHAYGHNKANLVKEGEYVDGKTMIAEMGGSTATGKKGDYKIKNKYAAHVDYRSFVIPSGDDWNISGKTYVNPKRLEKRLLEDEDQNNIMRQEIRNNIDSTEEILPDELRETDFPLEDTLVMDKERTNPLEDSQSLLDDMMSTDSIEKTPTEEDVVELETAIDRVSQQQSSGDNIPVHHLDDLMGKIDKLKMSQEDKETIEKEAINMSGYSDGNRLKELLRDISKLQQGS